MAEKARPETTVPARPERPAPDACPGLDQLETIPLARAIQSHVDGCDICTLVVEVATQRQLADQCERFDALLAARGEGTLNAAATKLLDRHLAACEICRGIAETMAPDDAGGDHTSLPEVDPSAYTKGLEFGRGGMGRVREARDLRIGRDIVIKELLDHSPHLAARFEREARVTARLQHPGIVPIYEIGKWPDGTPFYSMRFIEGMSLQHALETTATLRARLALLPRLIAACEAVAFAHSKRVIHRDLKPANIMLGSYGETIVIDWGLARDQGAPDDDLGSGPEPSASDRISQFGQAMGTAPYMPMEQAYGPDVDERADVYALGAILYQLLAGVPPYRGANLLQQVRTGPPRAIQEMAPESPPALTSIVSKAMARTPEGRYATARELAEELKRFQTGQLVESHAYSRAELIKRFVRRHRGALVATGLALAVLAVVTVFYVRGIVRSDREARRTVRELLFEKGRVEALAGNHVRGLAYLHEAWTQGERGAELDLLLGAATASLAALEETLDCRGDDRYLEVSPDGTLLAVACHDRARVWRIKKHAGGAMLARALPVATLEVPNSRAGFDNLAFSGDGRRLVTFGAEGIARLWNVEALATAPAVVREFRHAQPGKRPSKITFATFSSDQRRIATTGVDGFAQIWNTETGAAERSIDGAADDGPLGAVIRPLFGKLTGDKLVTLTFFGSGAMWDALTGEKLGAFQHGANTGGGDQSPDGTRGVTCGFDGIVKVLDLEAKLELAALEGHTDVVWRCVFDATSTRVLTSSHDGTSKVWELPRGGKAKLVASVRHGDLVWIGRFSPDGSRFVTISPGKNMKVWDSASGAHLATYTSRGKDAQFLPDNRLAALTGDGRIQIWSATSTRVAAFSTAGSAGTTIVGATRDAASVVTDHVRDGVRVWRASGERLAPNLVLQSPIATANSRVVAIYLDANADGDDATWGLGIVDTSGEAPRKLAIETAKAPRLPSELQLSEDGARVALMWPDRDVEIWDLERSAKVATLAVPRKPGERSRAVIDRRGTRAALWRERENADRTQTLISGSPVIFEVEVARKLTELGAVDARPIGFSADGRRLVVTENLHAESQVAAIWDVGDNQRIQFQRDVDLAPAIDPTGRWMTTIDRERDVRVWHIDDGRPRSQFNSELLQRVQASGDGSLLVAIGEYGRAVFVLSAEDGRVLARHEIEHASPDITTESFRAPTSTVWWSPDSTQVASIARGFASWRTTTPDATKVAELVRRYVPWRIENGRLETIRNGRIVGVVTRNGEPVAGASVEVLVRRPADLGDKAVNWDSMKALSKTFARTTDAGGRFAIDDLQVGDFEYLVTAKEGVATGRTETIAEPDPPTEIEIQIR